MPFHKPDTFLVMGRALIAGPGSNFKFRSRNANSLSEDESAGREIREKNGEQVPRVFLGCQVARWKGFKHEHEHEHEHRHKH